MREEGKLLIKCVKIGRKVNCCDWRGDKNDQSKAGQAVQGVELKKIEG